MTPAEEARGLLQELSEDLKAAVPPGIGFSLFIDLPQGWCYTSNCDRSDVVKLLTEWLDLTAMGRVSHPGAKVTSQQTDDRLALERRCAEIGKTLAHKVKMGLFLYEMGGPGNSAFFTSVPDFRERVKLWVDIQKNRS
jgi:hypothetical protein